MKNLPILFLTTLFLCACSGKSEKREVMLYDTYCASCHIAPSPGDLPKAIWEQSILPEMGARLGIRENGFDPYEGLSMDEQYAVIQSGIYPSKPLIQPSDWNILKDYILSNAPDSLALPGKMAVTNPITQFNAKPVALDSIPGTMITSLHLEEKENTLIYGEVSGKLARFDFKSGKASSIGRYGRGITAYNAVDSVAYITSVGYLDPSEIPAGRVFMAAGDSISVLPDLLHRPVHTTLHDLDDNGTMEMVICEFGDLKGYVSLYSRTSGGGFKRDVLLDQPGSIRTVVKDLDGDGRSDILVLTTQGDEGITVLYQRQPLEFEAVKLIRFSPVYGSSWFELIDYEGDGDLDIVTVHGDNADKSFVLKPYHGLRVYLNDGDSQFREAYFYPMHGATRVIAADFDLDGDTDFGLLSTFPDYNHQPLRAFTYLENRDAAAFDFEPYILDNSITGRWFLMDSSDIDQDGDEDIVLSSFTYYFSPVPDAFKTEWATTKNDILILENNRYTKNE